NIMMTPKETALGTQAKRGGLHVLTCDSYMLSLHRENCLSPVSPETCLLVQSYLTPSRRFISHAYAQLKTGLQVQDRHLFLFTDILLISKAKSSTNFKMKAQARVCEMWTADCMEEVCEGSTSLDKSFVIGWPTCNCVATFSSFEQKERWLSLIKSRIKGEKEKDHPKTIPLKVYAKDMGNFSYKTLAVSNSDNANEVTRLALQQFGIVGCVKDYQLWVSSRKDNAPYPLIGHEFPFSIQMSHIREPLDETGVKSEADTSPDRQVELLFDQLQSDSQCQFILKPSRVAVGHSFKPFKRRRSLINWAFWRGSTTQLDDPPLFPFPPATGRLFGLPLSVVCKENKLPKPIMVSDMLVFLFQEGPFTRGIFGVLLGPRLDFLRSIPCSLLMSDFYEKWMATMDVSDEANYNQLAASLPPENILLLKHVLAVLYSIQLRAQDNQMNAFNLAVCIASQHALFPAPSSPEMEGEGAKKVGYVSHAYVSSYQMTDSSYDSLENELNDDSGSPFQPTQRSWGNRDSCSRDSVLTLSDCDLDQPDTDPDNNPATPLAPPPVRSGKRAPVVSPCSLHPLFTAEVLKGVRQQRRCSEPAIWNSTSSISKYLEASTNRKGSYDSVKSPGSSDIDKMFVKHLNKLKLQKLGSPSERDHSERNAPQQQKEQFKPPPLHLETSYSSLYSPMASPTHSSVSSLDSAFSQHSADMAKTSPRLVPSFKASVDISPQSPGIASLASPGPTIPSPRESPPKEKFDWSHLRNTHGLHPNTWLKKDHRLSLSKDKTGLEDDDSGNPNLTFKLLVSKAVLPKISVRLIKFSVLDNEKHICRKLDYVKHCSKNYAWKALNVKPILYLFHCFPVILYITTSGLGRPVLNGNCNDY
uniref:Ras-associating domain-containing protein n=1 Tax=Electrophorus electricus TaxID=8005 RepID=A0AAY5EZR0_ELEEL